MLIAALLLSAAVAPQEEKPPAQEPVPQQQQPTQPKDTPIDPFVEERGFDFYVELRAGAWRFGTFDAVTTAGRRKIDQSLLFDAGVEVRGDLDPFTLTLAGDYAVGKDLQLTLGTVLVGVKIAIDDSPSPIELHLAVGPAFGALEVDLPSFGNFKSALGFEARLRTLAWFNDRIGLEFWFDYRQLRFDYEPAVISGDTHPQAGSIAFGAGLVLRF